MKLFLVLLTLAAALSSRADVLIYKVVQTNTWTGNGRTFKQVVSGRLVLDPQALTVQIFTALPNARFQVDCPKGIISHTIAPRGVHQSAWFMSGTARTESNILGHAQYYMRGNDTDFIGDLVANDVRAPKLLRGTYRAAHLAADGTTVHVVEGNPVASYLHDPSWAANLAGKTAMDVIETMRQAYLSKGWVEVVPDAPCL